MGRPLNVFDVMVKLKDEYHNLSIVNIGSVEDVVPTFREIFSKKDKHGK